MNEWQYECGGGDGGVVGMHRAVLILIYRFLSSAFRMDFSIDRQPVHYHFVAGNGFAYRLHTDGDDGEATAVIVTMCRPEIAYRALHINMWEWVGVLFGCGFPVFADNMQYAKR